MALDELTQKEKKFLARQLRNEKTYLIFSMTGILVALAILVISFSRGVPDMKTVVLVILVLLMARGNLKQHKDAVLLRKLTTRKSRDEPP